MIIISALYRWEHGNAQYLRAIHDITLMKKLCLFLMTLTEEDYSEITSNTMKKSYMLEVYSYVLDSSTPRVTICGERTVTKNTK